MPRASEAYKRLKKTRTHTSWHKYTLANASSKIIYCHWDLLLRMSSLTQEYILLIWGSLRSAASAPSLLSISLASASECQGLSASLLLERPKGLMGGDRKEKGVLDSQHLSKLGEAQGLDSLSQTWPE